MSARARVLVVGSNSFHDSMESHVMDALSRLGCAAELVLLRASLRGFGRLAERAAAKAINLLVREPERLAEPRLLAAVDRFAPSLVLVILGNQLSPKTMARLRERTRAPVVCWCQDALTSLGRQYLLGAGYDAVFVKDRYLQDLFSRMIRSTTFHYLPEACNPRVHRPVELSPAESARYACDIMVAGSLYYYRQEILQQLGEFDLRVWGGTYDWLVNRVSERFMGREVYGEDKVRAVRGARIALNTLHYAEIDALNCRAFELAGCGAFQLVSAKPVVREHFEPGVELETFASIEELIDKTRHYLQRPALAREIAHRGQLRAHGEHTYEHRLREIMRIAGVH